MEIERDIIENSKYIIKYFNARHKQVTLLMLENLLFFLEGIYMTITEEDKLYLEYWYTSEYGPINKIIDREYKMFGKYPINISTSNIDIPDENKKYIEFLYNIFKDYTAFDLSVLFFSEDSPFWKTKKRYFGFNKDTIINKSDLKEWFKEIIENSLKKEMEM